MTQPRLQWPLLLQSIRLYAMLLQTSLFSRTEISVLQPSLSQTQRLPVFVNKALLEHSPLICLHIVSGCFPAMTKEEWPQRLNDPQSLKWSQPGPLWKVCELALLVLSMEGLFPWLPGRHPLLFSSCFLDHRLSEAFLILDAMMQNFPAP